MTIKEKFNDLSLGGVQELINTISGLNDNITIGKLSFWLNDRKNVLEKMQNNNENQFLLMVGKYFIIDYVDTSISNKKCILIVHLTSCNIENRTFACNAIHRYGKNYSYDPTGKLPFSDLMTSTLKTVKEIDKHYFHKVLDSYRNLECLF